MAMQVLGAKRRKLNDVPTTVVYLIALLLLAIILTACSLPIFHSSSSSNRCYARIFEI